MAYKSIYRQWRPTVFEDIVGQSHITETLKNQIKNNRIGHAYLFCGTRGTGKTTAAKIFSRAVNCLNNKDGSPCNECEICRGISDGSIMDVTEIDAASNNGVDNIRELRDDTKYVTASAKYRIYIIDEVHMLSQSAFNALLKTLEEPPEHIIFILATTDPQQVPQTILSRCQRYDFRRIKISDIVLRLKEIAYGEKFDISEDAYSLIARLGDGSMRDAISVLERVVSSKGNTITHESITDTLGIVPIDTEFDMAEAIIKSDTEKIFSVMARVSDSGRDLNVFIDNLIAHFRNLLVCKVAKEPSELIDYSAEEIVRFKSMASTTPYERIVYTIDSLTAAKNSAKWVKAPRVIYETALLKMSVPELDSSNEAVLARLSDVEEKIKNGITVQAQPAEEQQKLPEPEKKKAKPSTKLFNPIPESELHSGNPIVKTAKKWDKIAASIMKAAPHLATAVTGNLVTIDNDGFIIAYDRETQMGNKNIAQNQINLITSLVRKSCGLDVIVKVAFKDEIEDYVIDFWSLPDPEGTPEREVREGEDPMESVYEKMADFIDQTDDREFVNFKKEDNQFSQSSLVEKTDESEEPEREEFFEENEIEDE